MSSLAPRPRGASGISVPAIGVGTNRWGSKASDPITLNAVYAGALDAGVAFFDSAEMYAGGRSELALGECGRQRPDPVVLATKFAPLPHRVAPRQLADALDRSLARLGRDAVDLYYLHFPYSPFGMTRWIKALGEAAKSGRVKAVGVSNCNPAQMRKAAELLERYGLPLAANQVHYSVLHRNPETNGVLDACREMGVALVAYRPIGGGAIASDGRASKPPKRPVVEVLREVGQSHGAAAGQIALAWLCRRDPCVVAIPGATKPHHLKENADALAIELSDDEVAAIDRASSPKRR